MSVYVLPQTEVPTLLLCADWVPPVEAWHPECHARVSTAQLGPVLEVERWSFVLALFVELRLRFPAFNVRHIPQWFHKAANDPLEFPESIRPKAVALAAGLLTSGDADPEVLRAIDAIGDMQALIDALPQAVL